MWKKIRRWLIKKLGAYEYPKYINLNMIQTDAPAITFAIDTVVDAAWYDDNMEYIKKNELAPMLGEKMIKDGLVDITMSKPDFTGLRQVRMTCTVVDTRKENR